MLTEAVKLAIIIAAWLAVWIATADAAPLLGHEEREFVVSLAMGLAVLIAAFIIALCGMRTGGGDA